MNFTKQADRHKQSQQQTLIKINNSYNGEKKKEQKKIRYVGS